MRFIAAILIAAALLGSVMLCQGIVSGTIEFKLARETHGQDEQQVSDDQTEQESTYRLVLTPAFSAVEDPFALRLDESAETPRVLVRYEGEVLFSTSKDVRTGESVSAEAPFSGERAAVHIEATPGPEDAARPCALRVQVFRDNVLCDDRTLWSEGQGQAISGELSLSLQPIRATLDRGLGEREE
jgi:hypothetical protein